ncbi:hypothetical protein Taro_003427 [Colocasia esculenta]|uniref:Uncharacterized protein n=1 Tax=Colocasia esculenta TaxID=4460 RepID=A0A843TRS5_COLES|nr:hypothetical protein [Colocasia esculenta]
MKKIWSVVHDDRVFALELFFAELTHGIDLPLWSSDRLFLFVDLFLAMPLFQGEIGRKATTSWRSDVDVAVDLDACKSKLNLLNVANTQASLYQRPLDGRLVNPVTPPIPIRTIPEKCCTGSIYVVKNTHRFELEGADVRVQMVCVVPLVVSSISCVLRAWCVIAGWFVSLVLLMMELLVEVFLVRRTVADRSGAVLLVIVGYAFGCMCSVVVERVCELWVPCVLLELFLICSGGGFSQNFFVLVSVLLSSGLRCVVGWLCVLDGALVVRVEAFVASQCVALTTCCGRESLWLAPCHFGAVGATMCTTPGGSGVELFRLWDACGGLSLVVVPYHSVVATLLLCSSSGGALDFGCGPRLVFPRCACWFAFYLGQRAAFGSCGFPIFLVVECFSAVGSVALALGVAHFVVGALPTIVCSFECLVVSLEADSGTSVCVLGGSEVYRFELEGADVRVQTVCVVPLVASSISCG